MNYKGIIIVESLKNKEVLKKLKILSTKVEKVMEKHQTTWLTVWTLLTVEIEEVEVRSIARSISKVLDPKHGGSWYADFNNGKTFYVIFRDKIFFWSKGDLKKRQKAVDYGLSLGIPFHQLDFP